MNTAADFVPMLKLAASRRVGRLLVNQQGFRKRIFIEAGIEAEKFPLVGFVAADVFNRSVRDYFQRRELFFFRRICGHSHCWSTPVCKFFLVILFSRLLFR